MALTTILLDNDGTLVDTYNMILESFKHATQEVLVKQFSEAEYMAKVGQPLATQMLDFARNAEEQQRLLKAYRSHNEATHDQLIRAFPGIVDELAALRAEGFEMGVVTSKMHALAWRGLQVVGAAPYLGCLIGADDCAKHKPDPAPILLGCERMGAQPEECVYVGDSEVDIATARNAGMDCISVCWGFRDAEELEKAGASCLVHSAEELFEKLQ